MKKYLLLLAIMSALLVSCEKPENNEPEPPVPEPEYSILIYPAELTFGAEGGEQTVTVTSSEDWYLYGESDWCKVSASYGENGDIVTVAASQYDNTSEKRTATFTFRCGDKDVELAVTQEAKVYSISVDPKELTFESERGEKEITIASSDNWSLRYAPGWITLSEEEGENGAVVTVTVGYNNEPDTRSGDILFACGDKEAKVTVTQKADDSPIIRFKDQYFLEALLVTYSVYWNDTEYYVDVDRNKDGQISESEAASVDVLDLSAAMIRTGLAIRNVDELSYFTRLRYLYCYRTTTSIESIESMDLSGLSQLEYLHLKRLDLLKFLDVSGCTALTYLDCSSNQLTSLDLSTNTALTYLSCSYNQLTSLDLSNNTALTYLSCSSNQLTSLDLSNNTALTTLYCLDCNQLTSLDVSGCTALTVLSCAGQLTSLDLSNNTALTDLSCAGQLTSLDLSNNTALTDLYCIGNQLTSLDLSNNTALTYLACSYNPLTSLDLSNNTALTDLYCIGNQLTSLDLHNNRLLERLFCNGNPLQKLILYKYHILGYDKIREIESEYGDIIEYME